jgi:hypothetical protein
MAAWSKDLILVGSVPLDGADAVLRACGDTVGEFVPCLPDGETGDRDNWIDFLALRLYREHPDVEVLNVPSTGRFSVDLADFWQFRVQPGVSDLRFSDVGYAREARSSYATFERLRKEGVIPSGVRFQVCLPTTGSGVHMYFRNADDWPVVEAAYADGMRREVDAILQHVPEDDLVIQWDMCVEVLDLAGPGLPWAPPGSSEERFARNVEQFDHLSRDIPEAVGLGFHFCYGTLGGWPMIEFDSLDLCVRLANEAVARSGRRVDYLHMPVPRHVGPSFYEPLQELDPRGARVYLGLIHHGDDVEAFDARVAEARRHLSDFGVASVCGYGRVDPAEIPGVLDLHRDCAQTMMLTKER